MEKTFTYQGKNILAIRKNRGETQWCFWPRFSITQSGGSRYETVRSLPMPLRMLLTLFLSGRITESQLQIARDTPINPLAYRKALNLSQWQFWSGALGVTQSSGSRYEHSTRRPAAPVALLLALLALNFVSLDELKNLRKQLEAPSNAGND